MILKAARDALLALLTTDTTFVAAVAALIGASVTTGFKSNRPITEIPAGQWPCWVVELGDTIASAITNDDYGSQTIGLSQQTFRQTFYPALVWQENDPDTASDARAELPVLLTQLLLRNPLFGGVDGATLTECQPDRGINHPTQLWRATIEADMTFMRA